MVDQRLILAWVDAVNAADGIIVTDGPAVGCGRACYAVQVVLQPSASEGRCDGRRDDSPRGPVPVLDLARIVTVAVIGVARGPAVRRRCACYCIELVVVLRDAVAG